VLLAVYTPDGSGVRATDIASIAGATLTTTSMSLAKLEDESLVTKRFPLRDARSVKYYLTSVGREYVKPMVDALTKFGQNVAAAAQIQDK
jgi:DNA-binding MarR family transcriptional regulator